MASFDIISAAGFGYRTVWRERRYVIRLATVPLFIKLLCYQAIAALGWEENFIRQALVMLPSFLADGWMLAHFVRLVYLDQRWPFQATGKTEEDSSLLRERAHGVFGGMLVFALTQFAFTGLVQMVWQAHLVTDSTPDHIPAAVAFAGIGFFVFSIWAFRLLWLYIPAAVSYPPLQALHDIRGYSVSFPMIGLWLSCFIPVFSLFVFVASVIAAPYIGVTGPMPPLVNLSISLFRAVTDTAVVTLCTAGMTQGMRVMISSRHSPA